MPDLTPLPPLPEPPDFAARREVFDAAARTARRRVRTSCAAVAAGVAVFAGAAALPNGSAPAVGIAPTTTGLPTTPPTVFPTEAHTTVGPARVGASPGGGRVEAGGSAEPTPGSTAAPQPDRSREPRPEPSRPAGDRVPDETTLAITPDDGAPGCHRVTRDSRDEWCYRSRGVRAVGSGDQSVFVLEVCRTGDRGGSVRFAEGREVRVQLFRGDDTVWVHDFTAADADAAHDVAIPGRECARWAAPWAATDDDGRALTPGAYRVNWWLAGDHDPGQAAPAEIENGGVTNGSITMNTWSDEYDLTVR
ncbi:MAG TPA: hypothetical protein VNA20_05225 [Frankiaceae bacterium]|nr:hypothetical protein [Frankiaceae bacterium]